MLQIVTVKIFISITTVCVFIFHEGLAVALLGQEAVEEIDRALKKILETAGDERFGEKLQICLFTLFII